MVALNEVVHITEGAKIAADFYIDSYGRPTSKIVSIEAKLFSVTVLDTTKIIPRYLQYAFEYMYVKGEWKDISINVVTLNEALFNFFNDERNTHDAI